MIRRGLLAGVVCLVAVAALHGKAGASVFCDADIAGLASVDAPHPTNPRLQQPRLALALESNVPETLSGDVVLLTQSAAYDVNFSNIVAASTASSPRGVTKPILVTFPKPLDVEFAWVDSIGVNGATPQACPTDPFGGPGSNNASEAVTLPAAVSSLSGFQIVPATFKMDLPAPSCKEPYAAARIVDWGSQETEYFDTSAGLHAVATVRVAVDSDGKAADVRVTHSSGSPIVDDAAVAKAMNARYSPAIFRCTPVVGEVTIDVTYEVGH